MSEQHIKSMGGDRLTQSLSLIGIKLPFCIWSGTPCGRFRKQTARCHCLCVPRPPQLVGGDTKSRCRHGGCSWPREHQTAQANGRSLPGVLLKGYCSFPSPTHCNSNIAPWFLMVFISRWSKFGAKPAGGSAKRVSEWLRSMRVPTEWSVQL